MDGFQQNEGVIVLGATNRRDNLDKYVRLLSIYVCPELRCSVNHIDASLRKLTEVRKLFISCTTSENIMTSTSLPAAISGWKFMHKGVSVAVASCISQVWCTLVTVQRGGVDADNSRQYDSSEPYIFHHLQKIKQNSPSISRFIASCRLCSDCFLCQMRLHTLFAIETCKSKFFYNYRTCMLTLIPPPPTSHPNLRQSSGGMFSI